MSATEYIGTLQLSTQQVALVIDILNDAALTLQTDYGKWHDSNPRCEIEGVEVGYVDVEGQLMLVIHHHQYGQKYYNPQTLVPSRVTRMIVRWVQCKPLARISQEVGSVPPVNTPALASAMPGYVGAMSRLEASKEAQHGHLAQPQS